MAVTIPKQSSAIQLQWDYGVYRNLAKLVLVVQILVSVLLSILFPYIGLWVFAAFLACLNAINMVALIRAMSRLEAGDEFSIYWLRMFIGSRRWRRSAPSPLSIHRYSLGHLFNMVAFAILMVIFIPWDPGIGAWITYAWWLPLLIGAGYTWSGYAASFEKPIDQPPSEK